MPELGLEFEVFCAVCGDGLCSNCDEGKTKGRGMPFIRIRPCETCMNKSREDGYEKGYNEAEAAADN
jgi:hypothetical protein